MVSWFVKQALVNIARDLGHSEPEPTTREGWAALAHRLGVKGVHIESATAMVTLIASSRSFSSRSRLRLARSRARNSFCEG
jgi:homospermidine synthase